LENLKNKLKRENDSKDKIEKSFEKITKSMNGIKDKQKVMEILLEEMKTIFARVKKTKPLHHMALLAFFANILIIYLFFEILN
jgi:hypothetical protein